MNQGIKIPYDFENMVMISRKDDSHVEGLQEQGKKPEQNIGSVTEAISREEIKQADCVVDLQLGRLGDFGNGFHQKDRRDMRVSAMGSPGKPRRSRVANGSNHVVSCLAEGCNSDFSSCKDYHKKHKVCDVHSKAPKVMVDGWEKRFCQQCSRFHLLAEFDQGKRSCRKRLDGHNKRRRKQKPEFMSVNSRNLFGNFEVTGFSPYINAHVFPSAVQDPNWTVAVKAEEDRSRGHQPPFPLMGVAPRGYNGDKSFPFLNTDDTSGSNSQISPDASTRALNSDCALYLLSSPAQPLGNLGHIAHADTISMVQPLVQGMEDEQVGSVLASESGTTQALPFSWH